jgi:hypothetical protein
MNVPRTARCTRTVARPVIEPLESRIAPASFAVTTSSDSGPGSLRQAILDANAAANVGGPDIISFGGIPVGTPFIIQPATPLPAISEAVIIDGYTAPGTSVNTAPVGSNAVLRVELDGTLLSAGSGLILGVPGGDPTATGGSTVRGLVIRDFNLAVNDSGNGILMVSSNNKVVGNFIGTDVTGTSDHGNDNAGVSVGPIVGAGSFVNNMVGGVQLSDHNVISGNTLGIAVQSGAAGTQIQGNLIGTDKTGSNAIPNNNVGISVIGDNTTIGGTAAGSGNVVSGNAGRGIGIGSNTGTTLLGNIIGLTAGATAALGNAQAGILLDNGAINITIGGAVNGAGNIISANGGGGIEIGSKVGDGAANNVSVRGNKIGTDATGSAPFGNAGAGIAVFGSTGSIVGGTNSTEGNVIAFNGQAGVSLSNSIAPTSVRVTGNSIHDNAGLGIDLVGGVEDFFGVTTGKIDSNPGPNGLLDFPILGTPTNNGTTVTIPGTVKGAPNTSYEVEFFAMAPSQVDPSTYGEGTVFLGTKSVMTDATGSAVVNFSGNASLPLDSFFSAVLIDPTAGNSSEFSRAVGTTPPVTHTWTGAQSSDLVQPAKLDARAECPTPFDIVNYNGGANGIKLDKTVCRRRVPTHGGTMTGTGKLVVREILTWTGGTQAGPGLTLATGGAGTFNGAPSLLWTAGAPRCLRPSHGGRRRVGV